MKTAYEKWMTNRILEVTGYKKLTYEVLKQYQLKEIQSAIQTARNSRFYRKLLGNVQAGDIQNFKDFKKIPFTASEDISRNPMDFLCVKPDAIARIVTINTSGTTGTSKRIYFTQHDLNVTVEFFRYGMLNLVNPGDRVLILMPGSSPASIGQLLKEGLNKAGCEGVINGPVYNPVDALEAIKCNRIDCIVGIPIQVYYLAKLKKHDTRYADLKLKSILLSADYVPQTLIRVVSDAFECPVFTHYGMTEMGYGGGVECRALNGYHMRDVDLFTEIIDPSTCESVNDGTFGEVVFTTLGREGMPLIRYRTGDIARFLSHECSCSKVFRRMDYVSGRISDRFYLKDGSFLSAAVLDETLLGNEDLLDYSATLQHDGDKNILNIGLKPVNKKADIKPYDIENLIMQDRYLGSVIRNNHISVKFTDSIDDIEISNGMLKRKLQLVTKAELT